MIHTPYISKNKTLKMGTIKEYYFDEISKSLHNTRIQTKIDYYKSKLEDFAMLESFGDIDEGDESQKLYWESQVKLLELELVK